MLLCSVRQDCYQVILWRIVASGESGKKKGVKWMHNVTNNELP